MWLTLNMIWCTFTLINLLGLFRTGAPQNTTVEPVTEPTNTSTTPSDDETTTPEVVNPLCIDPKPIKAEKINGIDFFIINLNLDNMWRSVGDLHPGFADTCYRAGTHLWDQYLGYDASLMGKTCPMMGEPFVPRYEKGPPDDDDALTGIVVVFGMGLDKLIEIANSSWKNMDIIKNLPVEKAKALVEKYEPGPWDPFFQIVWAPTAEQEEEFVSGSGCAVTEYKVNDTEALSKIFKKKIDQPTELWNLVCKFRPQCCTPGVRAWERGDCPVTKPTTMTTMPETSHLTMSSPNPTAPHPITQAPHATGKRIGQGMGFNVESLTILLSTIISGNLVHFLIPTFM
uniref:DNA repair and recombination protein radA n=1 Tax=Lygus hesperus TaxID=30085 RepID=A0A0A9X493_LYGHE